MFRADPGFVEMLETDIGRGLTGFSATFKNRQATFVLHQSAPNGGFRGRRGGSDLYYVDFALRALHALDRLDRVQQRTADYVTEASREIRNTVDAFNALNAARLLRIRGLSASIECDLIRAQLKQQRIPEGGYARRSDETGISALHTFLAVMCFALLREPCLDPESTLAGLLALRRDDGGFAESPAYPVSHTAATAAVIATCPALGRPWSADEATALAESLCALQADDGGIRAHAACETGDLLSSYNALVALEILGKTEELNLRGLADFLKASACPNGGFRSDPRPGEADIEYTYYGLGLAGLMVAR